MGLHQDTRKLLANRRETIPEIAAGSNVSIDWLYKINRGAIPDPGVTKLQRVHDYLLARQNKEAA